MPHVVERYFEDKVLVIGESPYFPAGASSEGWYEGSDGALSDEEQAYVALKDNIDKKSAKTYQRIGAAVPFEDIAFYNYYQRPAENRRTIGGTLTEEDEILAESTLRWLLGAIRPEKVIVASKLAGERVAPILSRLGIDYVVSDHPMAFGSNFKRAVTEFLGRGHV